METSSSNFLSGTWCLAHPKAKCEWKCPDQKEEAAAQPSSIGALIIIELFLSVDKDRPIFRELPGKQFNPGI